MALKITDFQQRQDLVKLEHEVLKFWDNDHTFEKSVNRRDAKKSYIFYDGPPFATGLPHYGHILSSTTKDVIPRYWTMKGYRVERVWGWDCHGIPIENMIEAELKLTGGKKAIEAMGIGNFNDVCRAAILRFDKEWEKTIRRMGRWVDFKNSYKTMDLTYMESIWWAFKELYRKGLVYQGKRVILYCPRCGTPLSNFEIAMDNSYKEIQDQSTIYKYPVKNELNTFLLAWSTTPWNKLATPALAVNPTLAYVKVKLGSEFYILAKKTLPILKTKAYKIVETFTGKDLEKLEFVEHYQWVKAKAGERHGVIIADDYVTGADGTGIVTLAIYGEDDYRVMTKHKIQLIEHVDEAGKLIPAVKPWAGKFILTADKSIDEELESRGLIYRHDNYVHRVPVCYRCSTRLYYAPIPAWFIDIAKLKPALLKANESINWYPGHLKHGRFGKGLKEAPDWNISRSRYWGTPMPVWQSPKTGKVRIIGSLAELKQWAVEPEAVAKLTDIHREHVDQISVWIDDSRRDRGERIKEVFDCWVESGSMSFASLHYPFANKTKFESHYPAQFISEYIAQTRAWFYTLHVMSVALFAKPSFENVLTTGTIMAEDGTKMSKSKRNFPDPNLLIEKYGVDALRFYLMSSSVMKADNPNFSEISVKEIYLKLVSIFYNVFSFYKLYVGDNNPGDQPQTDHVLDRWLVSLTHSLLKRVTASLDSYDTVTACRLIQDFVTNLSTWYLRNSRDRVRQDKKAQATLRWALMNLCQVMAPLTPFISEAVFYNLTGGKTSVHLTDWPKFSPGKIVVGLESEMNRAREITEAIHRSRKEAGIKVRQPLVSAQVTADKLSSGVLALVLAETNLKAVNFTPAKTPVAATLDTRITPALKDEGEAREIVRQIQAARKKAGTSVAEKVTVVLPRWPETFAAMIKKQALVETIKKGPEFQLIRL